MKNRTFIKTLALIAGLLTITSGCAAQNTSAREAEADTMTLSESRAVVQTLSLAAGADTQEESIADTAAVSEAEESGEEDGDALFTKRDLAQTADLTDAVYYTVSDGEDITVTEAGVYVLTGTASDVTVIVEAAKEDKVQLVLDGVSITNTDAPCIYVKSADKVFVTTAADSSLTVTGSFTADGETNTDGVIFSKDDLTLNGTASLTVTSSDNGVVCKDDLKITGGSYEITAASKCLEANDSIHIADGTFVLIAGSDAIHAENSDDDTQGDVYIADGSYTIQAGDDGIHAETVVQIGGGTLDISASEGIEATYVQISGGTIAIEARDDGINGAQKSSAYRATLEFSGGDITVVMASGDTDGIDCNGDLVITGGTIDVTGGSTFDIDGSITFTGGTVIVNGQQVTTIPTQMGMWGNRGTTDRGNRWGW